MDLDVFSDASRMKRNISLFVFPLIVKWVWEIEFGLILFGKTLLANFCSCVKIELHPQTPLYALSFIYLFIYFKLDQLVFHSFIFRSVDPGRHAHTFKPKGNLVLPIHLHVFGGGKNPEEPHTDTRRACETPHRE